MTDQTNPAATRTPGTDTPDAARAGRFTFPGTTLSVNRMGYGAMQLAGPGVFGPPKDPAAAREVLKTALAWGVDHIDTSDFYGPHVTNRLIREALHPYPEALTLVTKIGAWRDDKGGWNMDHSAGFLRRSVEDNLERLGLERMEIVNLRMGSAHGFSPDAEIAPAMQIMRDLQAEGLIAHIGISTVTQAQVEIARDVAPVVCVQNQYNLAHRGDDALIDALAEAGIAYVPYFPLGGFSPLQSEALNEVAAGLGATPMQVALAWLLRRAPNILLIPGTSSVAHLAQNVAAGALTLPAEAMRRLDGIGGKG